VRKKSNEVSRGKTTEVQNAVMYSHLFTQRRLSCILDGAAVKRDSYEQQNELGVLLCRTTESVRGEDRRKRGTEGHAHGGLERRGDEN